jgi:hypothetical protein
VSEIQHWRRWTDIGLVSADATDCGQFGRKRFGSRGTHTQSETRKEITERLTVMVGGMAADSSTDTAAGLKLRFFQSQQQFAVGVTE